MNNDFYTYIGLTVVWIVKYIFIPVGVAILAGVITNRVLRPQLKDKRKNGLIRAAFKN